MDTLKLDPLEEAVNTTYESELEPVVPPLPETYLLLGDYVQAMKVTPSPEGQNNQVMVTTFHVTGWDDCIVHGADEEMFPNGINTCNGWTVSLLTRKNIFPDHVTQIKATLYSGVDIDLMGMGKFWTDMATGQTVDLSTVRSYRLADGSMPDFSQYAVPVPEVSVPTPPLSSTPPQATPPVTVEPTPEPAAPVEAETPPTDEG